MSPLRPTSVLLGLVACALAGCTDASLRERPADPETSAEARLRVEGTFCTRPSAEVQFPVKVLYVLDQSTSLQCTDPEHRRFEALRQSFDRLKSQPQARFAVLGFSSWTRTSWTAERGFTRQRKHVRRFLDPSRGLGPATDYQGALATAIRILEEDMRQMAPARRARTRYVVNFVSDGNPAPRCLEGCEDDKQACSDGDDNDGDGDVDGADTDCANIDDNAEHPDNLYGVCNTTREIPDDKYVDMSGRCPAYNQRNQILKRVEDLLDLRRAFNVGGVTLNTVLLFASKQRVRKECGSVSKRFGLERSRAKQLLKEMAKRGRGAFRDVRVEKSGEGFLDFDVTSLEADQTMTSMLASNDHARLVDGRRRPDSDADGLPDERERKVGSDPFDPESDGDAYGDLFEARRMDEGFDPADRSEPAILCSSRRDGDGDALRDCSEEVLGTRPTAPDTDGDHVPDGMELAVRTDPLTDDGARDLDFDGVANVDEIRGATDPVASDERAYRRSRTRYGLEDLGLRTTAGGSDGQPRRRRCYRFDIRRIPLTTTRRPEHRGRNRISLYTTERPATVAGVPGQMRRACVEAIFDEGGLRRPKDGRIDIGAERLRKLRDELRRALDELARCPRLADAPISRGRAVSMIESCVAPRVKIGRRLYDRRELVSMIERHVDADWLPRLPERSFEMFVPVAEFEARRHCYRPWEIERLVEFLRRARTACQSCGSAGSAPDAGPR
ncbi:MAG: VWA domain-containing protein [Bradymonadaceae bacterium]